MMFRGAFMPNNICVFGDSVAKGVVFDHVKQKYSLLKKMVLPINWPISSRFL